jgi:alpha-L-fucosidase
MWDTKTTDYKITDPKCSFNRNPRSDIIRTLGDALRKKGLRVGLYFSKPDWNSPYFWSPSFPIFTKEAQQKFHGRNANYDPVKHPELWKKFKEFTWEQIRELMSQYGEFDSLWLDGGWVQPGTNNQDIDMDGIAAMARRYQPGLMVVDRTVKGPNENYLTPEGSAAFPLGFQPHPWEANFPIGKYWNYNPTDVIRTSGTLIRYLCRSAGYGGNLLLGISPDYKGKFQPEVERALLGMTDWLTVNGEAIYETRAKKPYEHGANVFTCREDGTNYVIAIGNDDQSRIPAKIQFPSSLIEGAKSVTLLGYGPLDWKKEGSEFGIVEIPNSARSLGAYAWVLKISK